MVQMRAAQQSDERFLFDLYASTRQEELRAWGWDELMQQNFLTLQWKAQCLSYETQFPAAQHQVILLEQRPIGRVLLNRTQQEVHIIDIALLPESRNQGVGSSILRELQLETVSLGLPLNLRVLKANPARRLYERLGFLVVEEDAISEQLRWDGSSSLGSTTVER